MGEQIKRHYISINVWINYECIKYIFIKNQKKWEKKEKNLISNEWIYEWIGMNK